MRRILHTVHDSKGWHSHPVTTTVAPALTPICLLIVTEVYICMSICCHVYITLPSIHSCARNKSLSMPFMLLFHKKTHTLPLFEHLLVIAIVPWTTIC